MENNTKNDTEWEIIYRNRFDHGLVTYALTVPLAFIGLFAYGLSLYFTCKSPRYHNAFGILCFAYVLFHIQTIGALFIWTIARITANMGLIPFRWRTFSRIFSPLTNSTLFAAIWMQLVLAINRLWAISRPITYDRVFSPKNARIIVVSLWLFSILITALYYNVECERYVEADFYSWSTLFGPCKHSFLIYIAVSLSDGIFLAVLIVNAIASYHTIAYLKKKKHQRAETQQKMGQEIVFFKETCVSYAIHAFFVIIFYIEVPMSRLTKITYLWLTIYAVDGLAFVFFNRRSLKKQNAVSFRTNTMDLRRKTRKNDLDRRDAFRAVNNPINIISI